MSVCLLAKATIAALEFGLGSPLEEALKSASSSGDPSPNSNATKVGKS